MTHRAPEFGITMFPTDYAIDPPTLARAVEERGFASLFFPEHTHIPASRATPFPGGGELPKMYSHTHDPFVALGACAAVTQRIRLGTGICLVIERDPITLAKEIASLDLLSGGRFVLGVGAGWNREEMENHGTSYAQRWAILRERILAMKAIWTEEAAAFHGEHVDFDPIWSWPKPVQPGGPPIWVGANSKWTYDRVAEYGDGWMPIGGRGPVELEPMRAALEARGRSLEDITLAEFGTVPKAEALRERIDAGYDHLVFAIAPERETETLKQLDHLAELVSTL